MMLQGLERLRAAITTACADALDDMNRAIFAAWGKGEVDDAGAEALSGAVEARRSEIRAGRKVILSGTMGRRSRVGARPISSESVARRRRVAASGWMPGHLASNFTTGELAALSIVACEVASRGLCRFTLARIAAAAGVSRSTVKRAIRQAQALGLVKSQEWRIDRWRSAPNTVTIVSAEWTTWLRMRSLSAERRHGGAVQKGSGFKIQNKDSVGRPQTSRKVQGIFDGRTGRPEPFLTPELARATAPWRSRVAAQAS